MAFNSSLLLVTLSAGTMVGCIEPPILHIWAKLMLNDTSLIKTANRFTVAEYYVTWNVIR